MAETKIEWTVTQHTDGTVTPGYTFNPWIGCAKVSQGCANCYAESFAHRYGKAEWGPTAQRVRTSAANWRKPLVWNARAKKEGRRYKVFVASLADVFENNIQIVEWRLDLFDLIDATRNLDWLLLTKRPENVKTRVRDSWLAGYWPSNVWIGTSVENQEMADKRIPHLLTLPASVRFLSCEPLLGPLDLSPWLSCCPSCGASRKDSPYTSCGYCEAYPEARSISWVICGGESGPQARPMHENWARSLRDQCQAAGVPYFFKQWGQWLPTNQQRLDNWYNSGELMYAADKETAGHFIRLASKHAAGRTLDRREWNEMPKGGIAA